MTRSSGKDQDKALEYLRNHPTMAARKIAMMFEGVSRRWLQEQKKLLGTGGSLKKVAAAPTGRTIGDFRKQHDQTWKIRDGLKRLFSGGVIMTDAEFREAVGGTSNRWRAAADATEFAPNRYRVKGDLLWASKETITEMRRIMGEAV